MNTTRKILLAGCAAFAGLCFAQTEPYAVIDLSGGKNIFYLPTPTAPATPPAPLVPEVVAPTVNAKPDNARGGR